MRRMQRAGISMAVAALTIAQVVRADCPDLIHFSADPGTYPAGGVVELNVALQCNRSQSCGPCTLFFHIGSGCGIQMGWVDVEAIPPGFTVDISVFMIIPANAPNGTYSICLRPQCAGCSWTCSACTGCDCTKEMITIVSQNHADIDGDGAVNVNDLLAVVGAWGPCPQPPQPCPADIAPLGAPDGVVNVNDLLHVISNWSP